MAKKKKELDRRVFKKEGRRTLEVAEFPQERKQGRKWQAIQSPEVQERGMKNG